MIFTHAYLKSHLPAIEDGRLREDILEHGQLHSFPSGQTILNDQQHIDYIPLITSGGAKAVRFTEDGKTLFLYFLRPGETCTMTLSSCLKRETSKIRAITIAETELILLPAERVYYYSRHFASWNEFVLTSFKAKFDSILTALEGVAFAQMEDRVINYLQDLCEITGHSSITVTHSELATDLGVSRVGLSRVLKDLEKGGKLNLGRKVIELTSRP